MCHAHLFITKTKQTAINLLYTIAPLPPSSAMVKKGWSYISTSPMGRTACTEPQCLYMGALYLPYIFTSVLLVTNTPNSSTTDTVLSTDSFIMKHTSRSKTEYNC